jgi:hypothetical protein
MVMVQAESGYCQPEVSEREPASTPELAAFPEQALQAQRPAALQASFLVLLLLAALPVEKRAPLPGLRPVSPPQEPEPSPVPMPVQPRAPWALERPQAAPRGRCVRNRGRRRSFRDSQGRLQEELRKTQKSRAAAAVSENR